MGPGMKSKSGRSLPRTPLRSASKRPSCRGTHVPGSRKSARLLLEAQIIEPTLILPVPSLNLFMGAFLNLPFQDPRPGWLVVLCHLQDVRCVDPIILATAHYMVPAHIELIYWNLLEHVQSGTSPSKSSWGSFTLLYVAE